MKSQKTKPEPKQKTVTLVTLKKMPKAGELAPQAFGIFRTLEAARGSMTIAALKAEMPKRVKTKQSTSRIWLYYRDALVKAGFISVKGAKK